MDDELTEAYRRTSFWADTPRGRLRLRIGVPNAELDALLAAEKVRSWAYLTAYNPGSVRLGESDNRRSQERLERAVREAGFSFFRGEGVGDDGDWPAEPSLLVLGITRGHAVELGKQFRQRAIVYGEAGGSPQLLMCP
jgi:hypothetical protein